MASKFVVIPWTLCLVQEKKNRKRPDVLPFEGQKATQQYFVRSAIQFRTMPAAGRHLLLLSHQL